MVKGFCMVFWFHLAEILSGEIPFGQDFPIR